MPTPDPRVPGNTRAQEAIMAVLFGTGSISLLGVVAYLAQAPFIFPSLGPTAFLLFHRPTASAASPRNVVQGHAIGVLAGVGALLLFGLADAPSALIEGVTLSRALAAGLSLGLTAGLMVALDRGHPPAGATTLIVSLGLMKSAEQLGVLMVAVVGLTAIGWLVHRLAGTPYPSWAPRDVPVDRAG